MLEKELSIFTETIDMGRTNNGTKTTKTGATAKAAEAAAASTSNSAVTATATAKETKMAAASKTNKSYPKKAQKKTKRGMVSHPKARCLFVCIFEDSWFNSFHAKHRLMAQAKARKAVQLLEHSPMENR